MEDTEEQNQPVGAGVLLSLTKLNAHVPSFRGLLLGFECSFQAKMAISSKFSLVDSNQTNNIPMYVYV